MKRNLLQKYKKTSFFFESIDFCTRQHLDTWMWATLSLYLASIHYIFLFHQLLARKENMGERKKKSSEWNIEWMKISSDGFTWFRLYGLPIRPPFSPCGCRKYIFSLQLHQSVSPFTPNKDSVMKIVLLEGGLWWFIHRKRDFPSLLRSFNFVCRVMLAYFLIINHFASIPPPIDTT